MKCFGMTDKGQKRRSNQDSYKILMSKRQRYCAAVVCDGMGGAKGGYTAARIASATFMRVIKASLSGLTPERMERVTSGDLERVLINAHSAANAAVYEKAGTSEAYEGMGTTLVAFLHAADRTVVINTGDSRLYAANKDKTEQITKDHSFVQYLLDMGVITALEAENHPQKNIILKVVGINEQAEFDTFSIKEYDRLLLCSDGLSNAVTREEIAAVLYDGENGSGVDCETQVDILIKLAKERGGSDNITAVVFQRKDEVRSNG